VSQLAGLHPAASIGGEMSPIFTSGVLLEESRRSASLRSRTSHLSNAHPTAVPPTSAVLLASLRGLSQAVPEEFIVL